MLQSSLPTFICDTGFTGRQPDHLPKIGPPSLRFGAAGPTSLCYGAAGIALSLLRAKKVGSGGGNHTHLKKFMRLLSVL